MNRKTEFQINKRIGELKENIAELRAARDASESFVSGAWNRPGVSADQSQAAGEGILESLTELYALRRRLEAMQGGERSGHTSRVNCKSRT